MTVATYQPNFVTVAFQGVPITGFAPGTFVSAVRNNDSYNLTIGSGGDGTRAKSGDKSGRITITLLGSSASNATLSAIAKLDETAGTGVGALLVKDLSGADVVTAGTAWITKPADQEKSNEETNREWIFETDNLEILSGGNVPTG
jgi:hypothetical protein